MNLFLERLKQRTLLGDGAMGTLLLARGASVGQCLEALVVENPTLVTKIHEEYARAGADVISTHTFGANKMRLSSHGLADRAVDFNRRAVELARAVREESGLNFLIAGNVGPVGNAVSWDDVSERTVVAEAFGEQIETLATGVDLLLFETFSDLAELEVAVAVAKRITDKPIVASMSYGENGLTLAGDDAGEVARRLMASGVDVVGANCSIGPVQMIETLESMRTAVPEGKFSVMPNAGLPVMEEGQLLYTVDAAEFAEYAATFVDMGAVMVGGCCGTTPETIAAMRKMLDLRSGLAR